MGKQVRKKRSHKKTTLFTRIVLGITLPLLTLTLIFTAIQLANEMGNLNNTYKVQSRFAFESIHRTLQLALGKSQDFSGPAELQALLSELEDNHESVELHIFSLRERKIFGSRATWNDWDNDNVERSLHEQRQGKNYIVRANKETKKLYAYIPLNNQSAHTLYIVRVQFPLANVGEALQSSRGMLIAMLLLIVLAGIAMGMKLTASILKPLLVLNEATQGIMEGKLGKHVHIDTGDEIENLAHTFNHMSDSLKKMKQDAEDSNPLTGIPGNKGIFQNLKKRIHERQKFVLFHTDLDRFKVFNDHFGLAKGDEAIVATADLLKQARKEIGCEDDFIGHQGGDDFVYITRPDKAKEVGEWITIKFDKEVVKALYSREDFERGHILQLDRRRLAETGEEVMTEFPLLALSLAGVSNAKKDFADYFDCMSSAVTVKKEVKAVIESSYLIKE